MSSKHVDVVHSILQIHAEQYISSWYKWSEDDSRRVCKSSFYTSSDCPKILRRKNPESFDDDFADELESVFLRVVEDQLAFPNDLELQKKLAEVGGTRDEGLLYRYFMGEDEYCDLEDPYFDNFCADFCCSKPSVYLNLVIDSETKDKVIELRDICRASGQNVGDFDAVVSAVSAMYEDANETLEAVIKVARHPQIKNYVENGVIASSSALESALTSLDTAPQMKLSRKL